jgi:hypothetical protein
MKSAVATASPPPSAPASAAPKTSAQVREQVLAAFHGQQAPLRVGIGRKLGAAIVATILLLMPLFYAGVIGGLVYWMYWLATSSLGGGLSAPVWWGAEVFAALILICLLKPLLEPQRRSVDSHPLDVSREGLLREFLDRVCKQIDAPIPNAIDVECSTRLVASARRGGRLTMGLPLVACLSVDQFGAAVADQLALQRRGAGSGLTNLIRGINGWLWRSVYGKSRFDQWLRLVAERPHFHLAKLLLPLAWSKFIAQAVLFVPMFIANTVAAGVVRRAELDADRSTVRLVGQETFAVLLERLELIDFTWEGMTAELDFLHTEQQLPESLPEQLAVRMLDMTPELCAALRETVNKPDEKPFDSRATNPERLAGVQEEPAEGVLKCDLPARALLADYPALARQITFDYYVGRFGAQHLKTGLQRVAMPAAAIQR